MKATQSKGYRKPFCELPADVHIAIAEQCEFRDLPKFCSISKWMHKTSAHVLYRDVDLSIHNRGVVNVSQEDETTQMWSDNSACTVHHDRLEQKQLIFLRSLTRHPEYAVYVRRLAWSMLQLFFEDNEHATFNTTWKIFRMMTNLRDVDVAWAEGPEQIYQPKAAPTIAMFGSVDSIRLVGVMGKPFPSLIFKSIIAANLRHLNLSNLQECGEDTFGNDPSTFDPATFQGPYRAPRAPGAMLGLLAKLTGRCTGLKSLVLRKVARNGEHAFDASHFRHDNEVYEEYAAFVRSVAPTLESLEFEQGPPAFLNGPTETDYCRDHCVNWDGFQPHQSVAIQQEQDAIRSMGEWPPRCGGSYRPMDLAFASSILKAVLESEWPCLKKVMILGVGAWNDTWTNLARMQLMGALGPLVEVVVSQQTRTWELAGLNLAMRP